MALLSSSRIEASSNLRLPVTNMQEYLPPATPFCTSLITYWEWHDVTYHLIPKLLLDHRGNVRLRFVTVDALALRYGRNLQVLCSDGLVRILRVGNMRTEKLYVGLAIPCTNVLDFCLLLEEPEDYVPWV